MPLKIPDFSSLSGLTPEGFLICQMILVFHPFFIGLTNDSTGFTRIFLTILGELHLVSPLFSQRNLLKIDVFGSLVRLLMMRLCRSPHGRIDLGILVRSLVSRKILQVGYSEIQRFRGFSSYVGISQIPRPVTIFLDNPMLNVLGDSQNWRDNFSFLLSKLPDPCALQNLVSSDNEDLRVAILCRVFRELAKNGNQLFLTLYYEYYGGVYVTLKRLFFKRSRSRSFREMNAGFRILKRTFRKQMPPGIGHFDSIDWIFNFFFEEMSMTNSETWHFLRRAFSERSLEALCDRDLHQDPEEHDHFPFQLQYPGFKRIPHAESIRMILFLRKVHSLQLTPGLIERFRRIACAHYDQSWKSIWACGLFWIVSLSSAIQTGDSFLNYIFNYVIHAKRDWMYVETLDLFLEGATDSEHNTFQNFWTGFNNLRGRYVDLGRVVSLAEVLDRYVEVLENSPFFEELQRFCTLEFGSQSLFEEQFLQFSHILVDNPAHETFAEWFYPRLYAICKVCDTKIYESRRLKSASLCKICVKKHSSCGWDESWSDDDD